MYRFPGPCYLTGFYSLYQVRFQSVITKASFIVYPPEVEQRVETPESHGSWKTILSYWEPVTLQGRTVVKLQGSNFSNESAMGFGAKNASPWTRLEFQARPY